MSNKPQAKVWSRWYEKDKDLLTFVTSLRRMPSWLLEAYCKIIIHHANNMYSLDSSKQYLLQHGSDKHLSLLKSMGRKRWYDKNKYAYRAFNALYLMEETSRRTLVLLLNDSANLLHCYQGRCELYNLEPSSLVFEDLLKTWVLSGEQDAYHQIDEFESLGALVRDS
jgi:hypothetical protein